ncbi:MAG: CPXCG motif-containing cysteine-rich protein [Bdellovibrionota bacterium]
MVKRIVSPDFTPTEKLVVCPFCGESFSIIIDPSEDHQSYIEDCYVCCRPIRFEIVCTDGEPTSVQALRD